MLQPKRVKHRKMHRGHRRGTARTGNTVAFGEFGIQALEPGWIDRAPDRGRPPHDHPPFEARRQGLDPRLPGQVRHGEAGRDPDGLGQGRAGPLGRRGQARAA